MKIIFDDDELCDSKRKQLKYVYYLLKSNPAEILEGKNVKDVLICPECKKSFVKISDRDKTYCSNTHAQRYIVRGKREELKKDPKKYRAFLDKQRLIMQKRRKINKKVMDLL